MSEARRQEMIEAYRPFALGIASDFSFEGADRDDVRQEAMIGLVDAIDSWDRERGSLAAFVRLVVTRRLYTKIRLASGKKHRILTESTRAFQLTSSDSVEWIDVGEAIADEHSDPAEIFERRERLATFLDALDDLSPFERSSVLALARGLTYREAAESLGTREKAVDNARGRAKLKVERRLAA